MADVLPRLVWTGRDGRRIGMIVFGFSISLFGVMAGLLWRNPRVAEWDRRLFLALNRAEPQARLDLLLQAVRPLGRGWLMYLAVGVVLVGSGWVHGVSFGAFAGLLALLEQGIKRAVGRRRPHADIEGTRLRIARPPSDPGYPSGDAARAWFLALAAVSGWPLHPALAVLACLAAALASVGRIRGGVHYPSDVLAGAALGVGLGMAWGGTVELLTAGAV
jgi:membrane-associated phospholipid phosphatase